ncbi:FecR domain-containing protein [Flavobacterium sp. DGU38]|uniref:FecR domain-containing protein n=1 Tax=Flavobacterium calami TaxID=3139144 RepID=A0ABU9IT92_9FLAO
MKLNRLQEEWNELPQKGIFPDEVKFRMWNAILSATINRRRNRYRKAIAASAALLISIAGYQYVKFNSSVSPEIITQTFPKDIRLIRLSDGTRVWVNENTKIEYPAKFASDERIVKLTGEAFFEVARDTTRPFIISSGNIKTTVLGTSFDVKAYGNIAEVNVRTGKVKVESEQNAVFLERGTAAVFEPIKNRVQKSKALTLEPEWKKALLDVDGLTFEAVIEKLKATHHFTLQYTGEDLKLLQVKGTLDTRQSVSEILQTLAFALEITIKPIGNDTYVVSR